MSCLDIQYATHMVTKYSSNPMQEHSKEIIYIAPVFVAMWVQIFLASGIRNLLSLTPAQPDLGVASSSCMPIVRAYGVALYTMKEKCIALSQAHCDVIPIMALLDQMREYHFQVICEAPCIHCKAFGDDSRALESTRRPKL
ncbi:hypothetical protein ACHAW6_014852 [Cyclotella cf. meneghiniana]